MQSTKRLFVAGTIAVAAFAAAVSAQSPSRDGLSRLLRGNDAFGMALLHERHADDPTRSTVVAPLSLTLLFAALQESSFDEATNREMDHVFQWGGWGTSLRVPARMILAALREPPRATVRRPPGARLPAPSQLTATLARQLFPLEAAWISNSIEHRLTGTLSERFEQIATDDYGFTIKSTGVAAPAARELQRPADIVVRSGVHLRTSWKGNTFSLSEPFTGRFTTADGSSHDVEMLTSEVNTFPYATTAAFEAVILPCNLGEMIAVLPTRGTDIHSLEHALAQNPNQIQSALQPAIGKVDLPPFRIRVDGNLHDALQRVGITRIFSNLGEVVKIKNSFLSEIRQAVTLEVDKLGIRADAETVGGAIYGGIMGAAQPFHMQLNRPFLFMIRDNISGALLFAGAVMEPDQK